MDKDSDSDYSPRKHSFQKQKALKLQRIENRIIDYECQPLLSKHPICDNYCLNFEKQTYQNQTIRNRKQKIEPIPLNNCKQYLQDIVSLRQERKSKLRNKKKYLIYKKKIQKRCLNLNQHQRMQIQLLQTRGYKNCIIAGLLGISTQQVRKNSFLLQLPQIREEIQIKEMEIKWIKEKAKQESNSMLFNASFFRKEFLNQFPNQSISINQFRKLLHQCQIRYRIPSLKPLQFFEKDGRKEETKYFISILCGYLIQNYKIIFIDECSLGNISKCSHKQWHILGSFKQMTHRVSSFKYLIGALGFNGFLFFQLFEGTGKAYIFQDFVSSIINKAYDYYKNHKFVLVMDNCSIHKSSQMTSVLNKIPCIFTPAYRPEFNAIEHMFGWIKRKLVISQPTITTQYIYQIHRILSEIEDEMIDEWCCSIFKPLLQEVSFIE